MNVVYPYDVHSLNARLFCMSYGLPLNLSLRCLHVDQDNFEGMVPIQILPSLSNFGEKKIRDSVF